MGINGSRIINIKNIEEHFAQCEKLEERISPIYGDLEFVHYKDMDFNIGNSVNGQVPHPMSIHYLVVPHNIILFPDFTLLEDVKPESLQELLGIIQGISQMAVEGGQLGIGRRRVAYRDRWGVVGELEPNWSYQQAFREGDIVGTYLSPQQMIGLSQNKPNPKYSLEKADVWALGLMLVQIIFGEPLDIYDFQNYEVRLNPLLEKLHRIKEEFGEDVSNMFVGMLEIEEEDRLGFQQLLSIVTEIIRMQRAGPQMLASNSSRGGMELSRGSRGNRTPTKNQIRTPKNNERGKYCNDVSPFRGRFGGAVKSNSNTDRMRRTPQRPESRSPMRRNLQVNTRLDYNSRGGMATPKDSQFGYYNNISPMGRR